MQLVELGGVNDCAKLLDFKSQIFLIFFIIELWLKNFKVGNIGCIVRKAM